MSVSADACLERPSKFLRRSLSFCHSQISPLSVCNHNVSYLYPTGCNGWSCSDLSARADTVFLHHQHNHPHYHYNYHHHYHNLHQYHAYLLNPPCGEDSISMYRHHLSSNLLDSTTINNHNSSQSLLTGACLVLCPLHEPQSLWPHIWRNLPDELIERILAFLPVSSIFRFTVVCKSWHALIFSRHFLSFRSQIQLHHSPQPQPGAYFLATNRWRYQSLFAYEVFSKKWLSFLFDFLPSLAYPVSSAGGLICFMSSNLDTGSASLMVCNPLTRKWKLLPSILSKRTPLAISMILNSKRMSYNILVAGSLEDSNARRTTEMYDSTTRSWVHCGPLPQHEDISRSMVGYNGYYLCLPRTLRSGLLAFNLETRLWTTMKTGKIPGCSKFRHLVECGGRILVVGKSSRRYVLGLYIWSLDPKTLRWKEVGNMPHSICEEFFRSPSECFYCTAQDPFIFFSRYFCNQGLVYNTMENSWKQVVGCPLLTHPLLLPFNPGLDPVD